MIGFHAECLFVFGGERTKRSRPGLTGRVAEGFSGGNGQLKSRPTSRRRRNQPKMRRSPGREGSTNLVGGLIPSSELHPNFSEKKLITRVTGATG